MDTLSHVLDSADRDGYVEFGDVARNLLNMQAQYASYYLRGAKGFPLIAEDLRVQGDPADYHSLLIHVDDVAEFVVRAKRDLKERGLI